MSLSEYMHQVGKAAREASASVCRASTDLKNSGLKAIGDQIAANRSHLMIENQKDLGRGRDNKLSEPMLDRLTFSTAGRIVQTGCRSVECAFRLVLSASFTSPVRTSLWMRLAFVSSPAMRRSFGVALRQYTQIEPLPLALRMV